MPHPRAGRGDPVQKKRIWATVRTWATSDRLHAVAAVIRAIGLVIWILLGGDGTS